MSEQHVLMVGGSAETETVLRTVLNPRGVEISRVRSGDESPRRPNVIVSHSEVSTLNWPDVPRVVIGKATVPNGDQLPSIFEYPDLVAAVDRLLRGTG